MGGRRRKKERKEEKEEGWEARCFLESASCVLLTFEGEVLLSARGERRKPFSCPCRVSVSDLSVPNQKFVNVVVTALFRGGRASRFRLIESVYAMRQIGNFVEILTSDESCYLLLRFEWEKERWVLKNMAQLREWNRETIQGIIDKIETSECKRPDLSAKKTRLLLHSIQ